MNNNNRAGREDIEEMNIKYQNNNTHYNNNCHYININDLQTINNVGIANCNIRSIDKNGNRLNRILDNNIKPDIILLTEIWQNHNNFSSEGYQKLKTKLRTNKRGGGVGILIKNEYETDLLNNLTKSNDNIEYISIVTKINKKKTIITAVYRPPILNHAKVKNFCDELKQLLDNKKNQHGNCDHYIGGDFNINLLNHNSNHAKMFLDQMENHNFFPLINKPTRIHNNTATLIDNIFVNKPITNKQYICPTSITDHFITITYLETPPTKKKIKKKLRIYKPENMDKFKEIIRSDQFNINNNNYDEFHNEFFEKYDTAFNECFPEKEMEFREKTNSPWINDELKNRMNKEHKLYIKAKNKNTQYHTQKHKEFKNELDKDIRKSRIQYHNEFIKDNINNSKKLWEHLNYTIKGNTRNTENTFKELKIGDIKYTNTDEIANKMNEFFLDIGNQIAQKIPHNQQEFNDYEEQIKQHNTYFTLRQITPQELLKINKTLKPKTSSGPDNIPSKIIKLSIEENPTIFTRLVNMSIIHAKVHNRMKQATIIPIYKSKGEKNNPNNHRPISLINGLSKIIEKTVAKQLREYMESNNIFYEKQFGFRNAHSTNHAMLSTLQYFETMKQENKKTNAILLDLSKAFDTVDHNILYTKLKKIGIIGHELEWFQSYLTNRTQQCSINNMTSRPGEITLGVPQGSILGPLLFCIYINDLPQFLPNSANCNLFADDTKLSISAQTQQLLNEETQTTLNTANKWFRNNKLSLNISKTVIIKYNNNNTDDIIFNGQKITQINSNNISPDTKSFKFLGFLIDQNLDFQTHTNQIIKKLNSAIYMINKVKNFLPQKQKIMLYDALFKSHMEYGINIWTTNKKATERIEKLQKKAIKLIDGGNMKKHTEPLFKKLKILQLNDLIKYHYIITAFTIIHNKAPKQVIRCFEREVPHPILNLRRNLQNFKRPDVNNKKSIFKYILPKIWNEQPDYKKEITSKNRLKNQFKRETLNRYNGNPICNINNCYICK